MVGSLVHSTWLNVSFYFTIIVIVTASLIHLISPASRPIIVSIVSENKTPSSIYLAWWLLRMHSKSPQSFSLLFLTYSSHLYLFLIHISFHLGLSEEIVSYCIVSYLKCPPHIGYRESSTRHLDDPLSVFSPISD